MVNCLSNVVVPLRPHPGHGAHADNSWPSEAFAPFCRPKHQPFRVEVEKGNGVCRKGYLIDLRVGDVVSRIQADDGGQQRPSSKDAGGQWSDGRRCFSFDRLTPAVDLLSCVQAGISLGAVQDRNGRDLDMALVGGRSRAN
jgi:hypothetical protein